MLLSEAKKKWATYGLNGIRELRELTIDDLIISYGDDKYGLKGAFKDCMEGKTSRTEKPLDVIWIEQENKFMLVDGHHRVVEGLMKNKQTFLCNIDWLGYTLLWEVPQTGDRYKHSKHKLNF